jgi:hypothetical protein
MSHADHEWAKEQIAAHLAGGLPAEDRARLEAHTATCAECIAEIDASRRFDRQMDDLFAPIRPKAGLEERVIRSLRHAPVEKPRSMASRVAMGIAAVVLLGILGFVMIQAESGKGVMLLEGIGTRSYDYASPVEARAPEVEESLKSQIVDKFHNGREGERLAGKRAEIVSADMLARNRIETLSGARFALTGESDHNESADGRSLGFSGYGRKAPMSVPPPPPMAKPMEPAMPPAPEMAKAEGKPQSFYSYRDDAPANNKLAAAAADPGFFKPGDTEKAEKDVTVALAKLDAAKLKPEAQLKRDASQKSGDFRQLQNGAQGQAQVAVQDPQPAPVQRKVIRTGEVEYEIEAFDSTVATISKIVEEEGGFIGTVNSDKLANGKVRGTVVLRCAPERLDTLLLKLRGLGELKSQNIRSQDVGKQYYDIQSRLKAARTMEERLLKIIKEGKGEIKDLLLAEKELGEWRTKIESYEGEIRYYDSQISLSTLTVTLYEKEIRSPFAVTETERVRMALEVEDVEKAHKAALAAVAEAKGRVTKSELKQLAAGQFSALVYFEVTPDAAGPLRDRFKQLGNVARLDIDRVQETEGGSGKVAELLKVRQKDTQVFLDMYNLANIQARETVRLSLACPDAEASYKSILARIEKAGGRVITSSLNRQKNDQTTGMVKFEIKSAEAEAVLLDLRAAGEVMRLDVLENPDTQNVTKSKRGFDCQLFAMGLVEPRETATIQIAAKDVPEAYRKIQEAVLKIDARILTSQLNEHDRQNVNATLQFDVRREHDAAIAKALAEAGEVLTRSSTRAQDIERVVDSKKRLNLTLVNISTIQPRETFTIAVEADNVEGAVTALEALAVDFKGRIVDSRNTRDSSGRHVSKLVVDLPLAAARGAAEKVKGLGTVRIFDGSRNLQAPEGDLAIARLDVTLSNVAQLVDSDSGPWTSIKKGLSVGFVVLLWSLTAVIVGLCLVVPVGLFLWGGAKVYRKMKPKVA